MRKTALILLSASVLLAPLSRPATAQARKPTEPEPDSEYVEKKSVPKRSEGGGLFDFLPFVGSRQRSIEPEKLEPSPAPRESRPVLFESELVQLRGVAEKWVLTTEFAEPTVRQEGDGRYYRDYIVFADEYEAKVLRGKTDKVPFIGHIYIKGDYFRTSSHDTGDDARADFKFNYQTREFRVVFDRVEQWEYSEDPAQAPFAFIERWEFRGLQSRPVVTLPANIPSSAPPTPEKERTPPPQPENE